MKFAVEKKKASCRQASKGDGHSKEKNARIGAKGEFRKKDSKKETLSRLL